MFFSFRLAQCFSHHFESAFKVVFQDQSEDYIGEDDNDMIKSLYFSVWVYSM